MRLRSNHWGGQPHSVTSSKLMSFFLLLLHGSPLLQRVNLSITVNGTVNGVMQKTLQSQRSDPSFSLFPSLKCRDLNSISARNYIFIQSISASGNRASVGTTRSITFMLDLFAKTTPSLTFLTFSSSSHERPAEDYVLQQLSNFFLFLR